MATTETFTFRISQQAKDFAEKGSELFRRSDFKINQKVVTVKMDPKEEKPIRSFAKDFSSIVEGQSVAHQVRQVSECDRNWVILPDGSVHYLSESDADLMIRVHDHLNKENLSAFREMMKDSVGFGSLVEFVNSQKEIL